MKNSDIGYKVLFVLEPTFLASLGLFDMTKNILNKRPSIYIYYFFDTKDKQKQIK